jgi:xanthine dehydrogenase YagR molybdenum-binding subunit
MAHGSSSEQAAMPLGLVGVGEVDITGAAAVASAVCHATGRRIREPPITLDKLL